MQRHPPGLKLSILKKGWNEAAFKGLLVAMEDSMEATCCNLLVVPSPKCGMP